MKIFSTFTGIGGFEIGIYKAFAEASGLANWETTLEGVHGHSADDQSGHGGQSPTCVGYSEIDKYASSVYERHFPNVKNYGDITKINTDELPDFDCLVGGFPCQAFSVAGKRRGFEDTRGTLFFDLARILKAKTPRLFVFENVKGLLSHDNGNTFKTIIAAIDELGYDCQWQVLNSKNHGVPQNRERVIIVGHLRGTPRPEVFPLGESNSGNITGKQDDSNISRTISARFHKGVGNTESRIVDVLINATESKRINSIKSLAEMLHPEQTTIIRRLTPIECERLQAFPDDWTKYGIKQPHEEHSCFRCDDLLLKYCPENRIEISDTQRYKMCGNAVTTNVIRDVFKRILL